MNKSTLAIVVSIIASASVHAAEVYNKNGNKLDVYGKVKAMHYMSDYDSKDGDQSYVRFGFKGETQINDQLTGYGRWEAEFAGNKAESDSSQQKTRLAFAGLKLKDIGSFDYGRNLGALYDVEAWTDMFPEFGGDSSAQTDNFMTKRASGLATYRNTDFFGIVDGLDLTLQYQGKNEDRDVKKQNGDGFGTSVSYDFGGIVDGLDLTLQYQGKNEDRDVKKQNGDGFGTSVSYDFGGSDFAVSGAYTLSDRTREQNLQRRGTGDKAEAWATGVKYDANDIYIATFYSETRNMTPVSGGFANKTQNFEAVIQYQFDFGLRPSLGYVLSKGKDIEGVGSEDLVNYIDVGATYYFNKNMSAFVDYKINQLDSDNTLGINDDDIVAIGLTYQF
ncbi:phosphoporin PhoE [Salmonella enterica]|nr:phosphoporin PhoE [Salmonella enterica]EKI3239734.1 phosphoporin PhoE [Salmonella enterica]EKI4048430.1 phosphoporin PhoE [Salmonella enterica]